MALRVGFPAYINSLPFSLPLAQAVAEQELEIIQTIPSRLNQLLKENQIDIALTSSVTALEAPYQFLPNFGIAASEKVQSVNLYTKIDPLFLDQVTIGVTHESAASFSLLKILCHQFWKVQPRFVSCDSFDTLLKFQAFLLIGDTALKHQLLPGYTTIDLATKWFELIGYPFVFALFSIRNGLSTSRVALFHAQIDQALSWSKKNWEKIEKAAVEQAQLPIESVRDYYSVLNFRIGKQEMDGLENFKKLRRY